MATTYPTYKTKIDLILKDKQTNTPLQNEEIRFFFDTELEGPLGGWSVNTTRITDANGIISTIITHQGEIRGPINAEFSGNEMYDPITIEVPKLIWKPELNGEVGADYKWWYSESNGEAIGRGFVFHNGFDNTGKWQVKFDFRHDNIKYTGICFLAKLGEYNGGGDSSVALTSWEGSWPGGSAYATFQSGAVGWFDVTVTKIDSTHVRLQSIQLDRDTIVEVSWLPTATKLSFGARHNTGSSDSSFNGPCRIKNIEVRQYYDFY